MQKINPNINFVPFESGEEVKKSRMLAVGIVSNNVEAKVFRAFREAPPWRYISEGLNLEAECKTSQCEAYKNLVWIQKGFGEFNIIDIVFQRTVCPLCKGETEDITNFGFLNCTYNITGSQMKPEKKKVDITDTAPKGGVTTFEPGEASWGTLNIKTEKDPKEI